jgi:hypothetical protein
MATAADSRAATPTDDVILTITEKVASAAGTEFRAMPPLGRTVDPEAIEALVAGDGLWDLTFLYHDHLVTVEGDGNVRVSAADENNRSDRNVSAGAR